MTISSSALLFFMMVSVETIPSTLFLKSKNLALEMLYPQNDTSINIHLAAYVTSNFERWFASACENITNA